jgi:hypothetical protein
MAIIQYVGRQPGDRSAGSADDVCRLDPRRMSAGTLGRMRYRRMPIETESLEEFGYDRIRFNLAESSISDTPLRDLHVELDDLVLMYGDHLGQPAAHFRLGYGWPTPSRLSAGLAGLSATLSTVLDEHVAVP